METGESNLYYCIIVTYTKARVREVFFTFWLCVQTGMTSLVFPGFCGEEFTCGVCQVLVWSLY